MYFIRVLMFIPALLIFFIVSGCSLFQASPEEVEKYKQDFIAMVDKAAVEAKNGQTILAEVRHKVDKEGLKRTKVQNTLSDATTIAQAIKDDVIKAQIPSEMEPVREKLILALDKRVEAYDQLFIYYDLLDNQYRVNGDSLLEESMKLFDEAIMDLEQFRK